ncbi:DUF3014 domain-containing protein [Idiomarina tyrosinivorans]|uniref:DUF3014 domain-containing protein n=1 Tax=Idiomarina tyrosinivorans TaxID=1445662 RepID=A0A432ZSF6_9GAMM|nr:DUF3014 domain-containing protein [Idiomarina tyrosinivorans]RUO80766.1 DUF3014 domain-containing protein [Idiomarina tyrosinivorans]
MSEQPQQPNDDYSEQRSGNRGTIWGVVIILVLAAAAAVWWFVNQDAEPKAPAKTTMEIPQQPQEKTVEPEPEPEPQAPAMEEASTDEDDQTAMAAEPEPEPEVVLPELGESTPTVLQRLDTSDMNIQPLKSSQLIRDAVVLVDNLRNGLVVRDRTIVQRPEGRFSVVEVDDKLYIDEVSYHRYDTLVDWFVSLDPQALVDNLDYFYPLVEEAYGDIGYPDKPFTESLLEAINVLLDTPVPDSLVEVKDDQVMYTYADPALEALPPAQKQLLRMGPANIQRVKKQLRNIKAALQQSEVSQ